MPARFNTADSSDSGTERKIAVIRTANRPACANPTRKDFSAKVAKYIRKNYQLLFMILLPLSFVILFSYVPMYGLQIAI